LIVFNNEYLLAQS